MKRREFFTLMGGAAAAWPLAAHAQQPALPLIGFVNSSSLQAYEPQLGAFLKGLGDAGYVVGRNVAIEYRWANGENDRLPSLVADLIKRRVAVIVATTTPAALAVKAATTTIPVVFETGADPITVGLVASLNHPGGNFTGVTQTNAEITPKRLQLLHELLPMAKLFVLLVNPSDPANAERNRQEVQAAASRLGLQLHILDIRSDADIDQAFEKLVKMQASGVVVGSGPFFVSRTEKLAALGARHAVPIIYEFRRFAAAGGLISYGSEITEAYRLTGTYTGRILKGDKPADLPVQQATRVELIINLKTANALGIAVPNTIVGRADEVIE
jgi:putative tryptophan/tyrosine transport system substrate-binding protein